MSADLNARALAALPPTLQVMVKAHPYPGEREDLGQGCWRRLLEAGPEADLRKVFASARAEARRYALRGWAHDGAQDEADEQALQLQAKEGTRAQQRDAVAAVAGSLRVGLRQARRIVAAQKEKAAEQASRSVKVLLRKL
ncbi:hypothetical protein [[Acidovorax] ebreus]|uniref:hypothetical protein n=1 Tax=Diaphorobacter sp. LI3 TaxID=2952886 RepID=UPI00204C815D|nr:hypothetical protein MRB47_14870 [Diaphorobacter sp. LI3]